MIFRYYFEEREMDYCLNGKTHCSTLRAIAPLDAYEFFKTISKYNDFETSIRFYPKR